MHWVGVRGHIWVEEVGMEIQSFESLISFSQPPLKSMFDEFADMKQSRPAMRLLTIIWLMLFCAAMSLRAQTANQTNAPSRPISMHESIEIALQHILDVQIERINPLIARHNLSIAYADWQPAF